MDNEFRLEVYLKEKRESVNDTLFKVLSLYDTNRELISAM
jgi:hypothetical protein